MEKSPEAFRTISEAAEELDLPQHVLRFWETRFSTIRPLKRGGGRRYYRPDDVLLLKGIRHLLYDQGFTIKGVQRILKDRGPRHVVALVDGRAAETFGTGPTEPEELNDPPGEVAPEPDTYPAAPVSAPGGALDAADRQRLEATLRSLLECKRLLERAREP